MEILVLGSLIVARGAEHGWVRAVTVQQALQGSQLVVRDSLGGKAARHPLQSLANREQLGEVLLGQLDDADTHPRRARDETILETPQRFPERSAADPQLAGNLGLWDPLTGLELTSDDRLDDLAERFAGDRRWMGNGLEHGHEWTRLSY